MSIGIRSVLSAGKICTVMLLGVVLIAMVILPSDVTLGQSGTWSQAGTLSFVAIDLHPDGFAYSEAVGTFGGQQVGYGILNTGYAHALLWSGSAASVVDLHPAGLIYSEARGTSDGQQVGFGWRPIAGATGPQQGGPTHALLWYGSAASVVDLNPSGSTSSYASGISGGQIAGDDYGHALLWKSGSAANTVDLNPSGSPGSHASGIFGGQQVGYKDTGDPMGTHALLWRGTAASAVDLNPAGWEGSVAIGVSGGQQVGTGSSGSAATGGHQHALLWRGTAASVVDLHPNGLIESVAEGVSGGQQVGYGEGPATGGVFHALLWRGSASSVVDLHAFLPPGYAESKAYGIDPSGDIVGEAMPQGSSLPHAFRWVPTKKPGTPAPTSLPPGLTGLLSWVRLLLSR